MKKTIKLSLAVAALSTTVAFGSTASKINDLQKQIDELKAANVEQASTNEDIQTKIGSNNLKWGVDFRTAYENLNYDMADGSSKGNDSLATTRLWLNMAYAPNENNLFKGQLAMYKAFGADFGGRGTNGFDTFDWISSSTLLDNTIRVRQASWVYKGENAFGVDGMDWGFSLGRRPSNDSYPANFREDLEVNDHGPIGHIINIEFDGFSSRLNLSAITGVEGMALKVCGGYGATNAAARFSTTTDYDQLENGLDDITMIAAFFTAYNDGKYSLKMDWFSAFDLVDLSNPNTPSLASFETVGNMESGAIIGMIEGFGDEGMFSEAVLFASAAYSKTHPDSGFGMLGSSESETGYSFWTGLNVPVVEDGVLGVEYNHGSQYWRSFTYGEDSLIGSKIAARGDAFEGYFTYQFSDSMSAQLRYTYIDYEYTGSSGFFGNTTGTSVKISDVKNAASTWNRMTTAEQNNMLSNPATADQAQQLKGSADMLPNIVDKAQELRFYIRYRF